MSLPLFEHLASIARRFAAARHRLLSLDYDGTLTPLARTPAEATLSDEMRRLVRTFVSRAGFSTAIVSGRAVGNLRSMVGIDDLIYAGNHGFEISGPGLQFIDSVAAEKKATLAVLAQRLGQELRRIGGAFVEDKSLTLTVHYRLVERLLVPEVHRIVETALIDDLHGFQITHGKMALELRPSTLWHKGKAVDWIRGRACAARPLTFYFGDDQTDEDAFEALPDEITVKVGGGRQSTKARYHIDGPDDVATFLRWLDRVAAT